MRFKLSFAIALIGFIFYCFITAFTSKKKSVDNNPPKVSITTPGNNGKFNWNSIIRYRISVSDKEDGSSEYNEITANEVLLEVLYLPDSSKAEKYLSEKARMDTEHPGLSLIKNSGCFNCHAAKNKLIGPSFDLIAKQYPYNPGTIEMLTRKVINGSSGVWGDTPMPANPTLKTEQARQIISWTLKNNLNPNLIYFPGMEGTFRTKEKPANDAGKGVYILTASYTDHGVKGSPQVRKYGKYSILLKNSN